MGSLSIQFHALPEEVNDMVMAIRSVEGLNITSMGGTPFRADAWDGRSLAFENAGEISLGFTHYPVDLNCVSRYDFVIQNPNALVLDIGQLTKDGLKRSWLSCKTDDEVSLSKWKEFATIIKKKTKCGAVAINPQSGETSLMNSHRYTDGALRLFQSGVDMLPVGGIVRIQLGNAK
ncbi:hypothetical protein [Methylomonas sp. YC3]